MEMTHQFSFAALDVSMRRLHTNMHRLEDTVVGIAQRLEDKMDGLAENSGAEDGPHPPRPPRKSSAGAAGHCTPSSSESGPGVSGKMRSGTEVKVLNKDRMHQGVEPAADHFDQLDPAKRKQSPATYPQTTVRQLESHEIDNKQEYEPNSANTARLPVVCTEEKIELAVSTKSPEPQPTAAGLMDIGQKFVEIEKRLEKISHFLGMKTGVNDGDDDEDRRRLKEKLKLAIEVDRRSHIRNIVSRSEVWMEYIFGICSPDQRMGKRGSR